MIQKTQKRTVSTIVVVILLLQLVLPITGFAEQQTPSIHFNGYELTLDTALLTQDDDVFVPIRPVFEAAGATLAWDEANETARIQLDGKDIAIRLHSDSAQSGGTQIPLGTATVLKDGRVMIPAQPLEQLLGALVEIRDGSVYINYSHYYPTTGWKTAIPEQQGMDSQTLSEMLRRINQLKFDLDGMVVVKNGYIVEENYRFPFGQEKPHSMYSVTKSVASLLCGVAVQEGYIQSADQRVLDFYPELDTDSADPNLKKLQIKHLLTMTAGIGSTDSITEEQWQNHTDLPVLILSQPFESEPGTKNVYDNSVAHVLTGLIARATGKTIAEYSKEKLFDPLGIDNYHWDADPNGLNYGGYGLYMTVRDMAKFGYLCLKQGQWDGSQLVPKEWIDTAGTHLVDCGDRGYGYYFWIEPDIDGYSANGSGGQLLFVLPETNTVAAITASADGDKGQQTAWQLVRRFIIPAAVSLGAIPDNPEAHATQVQYSQQWSAVPEPKPVKPLPQTAFDIGGRKITTEENTYMTDFSIAFEEGSSEATMRFEGDASVQVGLDGVYRIDGLTATMGEWISDTVFEITTTKLFYYDPIKIRMEFSDDSVKFSVIYRSATTETFSGTLAAK